jgi:hypothetical protein
MKVIAIGKEELLAGLVQWPKQILTSIVVYIPVWALKK